ncbi:MAG: ABC transporter permease [Bacteroidales bacterium]|nr:ABC transporter permease [Bacteroidales bacterium]
MLKSYFIIAVRNLIRQKGYFIINLLGLTIGLTACLLISFYVIDDLSYDKFHEKGDRIYRVGYQLKDPSGEIHKGVTTEYKLRELFVNYYNQIESFVRISTPGSFIIKNGEIEFYQNNVSLVEKDFFNVFTYEWIMGDKETALNEPFSAVITESVSKKYFGDSIPIGKTLDLVTYLGNAPIKITGVIKDMPNNSHFNLSIMASMESAKFIYNDMMLNNWGEMTGYSYILLPEKTSIESLHELSEKFIDQTFGEDSYREMLFQPLFDIHLHSNTRFEIQANGNIRNVIIFSIIAIFILLIATINYMNLATARSAKRSLEVGMRKILGAKRRNLVIQFIGEATLISFISVWLSIALSDILMPYFNQISNKQIDINWMNNLWIIILTILFSFIIGIVSGSYPAFYLSSFKPLKVLKERNKVSSSNSILRKGLIVSQFVISTLLIICTLVVFIQYKYMKNKPIGINPTNIVNVRHPGIENYQSFKQELLKNPLIKNVTASNKKPTRKLSSNLSYKAENVDSEGKSIKIVTVDYDFFETLENKIIEGRSFSNKNSADQNSTFIINEQAMKEFGWDNTLGKTFTTYTFSPDIDNWIERKGTIIGVAEDFHFESVHNEIVPVVYFIDENWRNWVSIKISSSNVSETMKFIKKTWDDLDVDVRYDPSFYEENLDSLYRAEKRFFILFIIFSSLAISIACLGIFGLASFTAEQKTKEIGIRKVMGASVTTIIKLINKEFLKLVLVSNIIAWPIAWYFMKNWLNNFTYRIDLSIWPFLLSGIIAIFIALASVSYQALKASSTNPVNALRYE